jgi:hypothetical protein
VDRELAAERGVPGGEVRQAPARRLRRDAAPVVGQPHPQNLVLDGDRHGHVPRDVLPPQLSPIGAAARGLESDWWPDQAYWEDWKPFADPDFRSIPAEDTSVGFIGIGVLDQYLVPHNTGQTADAVGSSGDVDPRILGLSPLLSSAGDDLQGANNA